MNVSISLLSELRFSSTVLVFASHFLSFSLSFLSDFGVISRIYLIVSLFSTSFSPTIIVTYKGNKLDIWI